MTAPLPDLSAHDLTQDRAGFLRLDRTNIHAQILLHLSQDETAPTKVSALAARLPRFTYDQIVNALRRLVLRKVVANVGYGRYVARYAHVPGVDA